MVPVPRPIESILATAVELASEADRQAFVERACAGDAELKRRVEELIENHFRAGSFLESAAWQSPDQTPEAHSTGAEQQTGGTVADTGQTAGEASSESSVAGGLPDIPGYEVQSKLGEGGMGAVWKAWHRTLARVVALKTAKAGEDPERFLTEARAMARLEHPLIVPVYEVGESGGRPFFAMEYLEGGSLDRYLAGDPLPPREAAGLVRTLAQAVAAAHRQGVIHRDLKPANVLLAGTREKGKGTSQQKTAPTSSPLPLPFSLVPKITDFGLAKLTTGGPGQTQSGIILGTPSYMSPEQAAGQGKTVGPATDIYALGAILYECLTGRPPFKADSTVLTIALVLSEDPVSPRHLQPGVPKDLETICLKCLHKEPAKRYPSADALAEDLRRFGAGVPITARPVGLAERGWRWCRRNPAVASLLGVTALLLVAGTGISTAFGLAADAQRQRAEEIAGKERKEREEKDDALQALTVKEGQERTARQALEKAQKKLVEALAAETRQRKEVERVLHAKRLSQTLSLWEDGNIRSAREMLGEVLEIRLDEKQEPQDTWEYRCLNTMLQPHAQRTFRGHTDAVTSVCFSPDGKRLASGSSDRTVKVWDAETSRELFTLKGHAFAVTSVCFSPDGNRIASGGGESFKPGEVKLWDAATGKKQRDLRGHTGRVSSVAFSPDCRLLASTGDDFTVKLWDPATGEEVRTLARPDEEKHAAITGVAFSPNGRHVATVGAFETATVWETATGKELWHVEGSRANPFANGLQSMAFSPDGRRLVAASMDGSLKMWDARSGKQLPSLPVHQKEVDSVAFTPDGRHLASAGRLLTGRRLELKVWDAATGRELRTLLGHTEEIHGLAFSPEGRRLASASNDRTVKLWNALEDPGVRTLQGYNGEAMGLAFSPDGKRLASGNAAGIQRGEVKMWDPATGADLLTLKGHTNQVMGVAFSRDGKHLASSGGPLGGLGEVILWDATTGKQLHNLKGHTREVWKVAFSPDGKLLVSASNDQTMKLWDPETGKEIRTLKNVSVDKSVAAFVTCVAFGPDDKHLASGSSDATVRLWNLATGQELRTFRGHFSTVFGVAFSPDGKRLASASADRTVRIWETATGQELLTLRGHLEAVLGVAFSPDGRRLATGSMDQTTKLWDAATGQDLLTFKEYGLVPSVAFSPDGKRLASAVGGVMRVREAEGGQEVRIFKGHRDRILTVVFSPDGKRLVSMSEDQTVKLWDAATGENLLTVDKLPRAVNSMPSFGAESNCLVLQDRDARTLSWDLTTGKRVDRPAGKTVPGSPRSPDGRLVAVAEGKVIYIQRLQDKEPEQAGWRWWIDPAPWWHAGLALQAEANKEWFAAAFHLGRLLLDQPNDAELRRRRDTALKNHSTDPAP
jgi:WD40 repeat protein